MSRRIEVVQVPRDVSIPSAGITGPEWLAMSGRVDAADAAVMAFSQEIARMDRLVLDVSRFGATGDGVTDDTAAIQAAFDAVPGNYGSAAGADIVFPPGFYVVSSTIRTRKSGIVLRGSSGYNSVLRPSASFAGDYVIHLEDSGYVQRGPQLENIVIHMGTSTASGIKIVGGYDQFTIRNVYIRDLHGSATGIAILPQVAPASNITQTLTAENCWISGASDFSGVSWHMEHLQEAVFINCKGIGAAESTSPGKGTAFRIRGCNGVQFYGCSAAICTTGFDIAPTSARGCTNILIDAPTIEGVLTPWKAEGTSARTIQTLTIRAPRRLAATGAIPAGANISTLTHVNTASIEALDMPFTLESTAQNVRLLSTDNTRIVNNGVNNTITVMPNYNNGYRHAVDAPKHALLVEGNEGLGVQPQTNTGRTPVMIRAHNGTTWTMYWVEVGPANSGGTGFRALRIAN